MVKTLVFFLWTFTVLQTAFGNSSLFPSLKAGINCSFVAGVECTLDGYVSSFDWSSTQAKAYNYVSGTIPSCFGNLTKLVFLSLALSNLTGPIPVQLCDLVNLQHLDFQRGHLSGNFPACLGNLTNLNYLSLGLNKLQGAIPVGLCNLTRLGTLDLSFNSLSGPMPSCLGVLANLTYLDLGANKLTGDIPSCFKNLTNLAHLSLASNRLGGPVPLQLCTLTRLTELDLSGNNLSGTIPSCLGDLIDLTNLSLDNNKLTGPAPLQLCNLTSSVILKLDSNSFTWPMPEEICGLRNLGILNLASAFDASRNLTRTIPDCLKSLPYLGSLNLSGNILTGPIPQALCSDGVSLDLSRNLLSGNLPECLANRLELYVQDNQLTGGLPQKLLDAASNGSTTLDVRNNFFTFSQSVYSCSGNFSGNCLGGGGACGSQRTQQECNSFCNVLASSGACGGHGRCSFNASANATCACDAGFEHTNASSCVAVVVAGRPPPPPSPTVPRVVSSPASGGSNITGVVSGVTGVLVVAIIVGALACYCCLKRRRRKRRLQQAREQLISADAHANSDRGQFKQELDRLLVREMSLDDIRAATDGFSQDRLLGKGGYGSVYLGASPDGRKWAVKRSNRASYETLSVFRNEVKLISRINHRSLVQLLGYCNDEEEQVLVYEYVPRGTLQEHLHGRAEIARVPLTLDQRLLIAVGTAKGLDYLHSSSQEPIVHRDVKSANILLDDDFQAKIADFGLSKVLASTAEGTGAAYAATTGVAGTYGYMDPDTHDTFEATASNDVFSFGVVLLELLTGRPAIIKDPASSEPESLFSWALPYINNNDLVAILDPDLGIDTSLGPPPEKAKVLATVARLCLWRPSSDRPSMAHVLRNLEAASGQTYTEPPPKPGRSQNVEDYTSRTYMYADNGSSSYSRRAPLSHSIGPR
eukprot:jgi/Mesen1/2251/ME000153S01472